jgi:hypothetical protein
MDAIMNKAFLEWKALWGFVNSLRDRAGDPFLLSMPPN